MRKVAFVINTSSGLYNFRRELVERLLDEAEVYIIAPDTGWVDFFKSLGCRYASCEFDGHGMNPVRELELIRTYKRILAGIRPDIALTYTIKPNAYAGMACAALGIEYVANITGLGNALEKGGLKQWVLLTLCRYGLRKARKVFFQNAENLDFMKRCGIVRDNYDLLPGSGVNLQQFHPLPYPEGEPNFIFVSRVLKEKGIDQYIEAAREIRHRHPEARFHIFGACEPAYRKTIDRLNGEGVIEYHGNVLDMIPVYTMSVCTIHPSYYPEGMSNVLLESCACARPIITTDQAGCREAVENGVNGFIVKPRDAGELIEKIEAFLSLSLQARKEMGLASRKKVEREFDREIVIQKYLAEIRGVKTQRL